MIDRSIAPDCEWGGVGCDNMTFMIVAILGDKTKSEWYDMICDRLQNGEGHQTPTTFPDPFAQGSRGFPLNSALSNYNEIASPPSYQTSGDESNDEPESNEVTQSAPNSVGNTSILSNLLNTPSTLIEAFARVGNAFDYSQDTPDQEPPPSNPNSSFTETPPPSLSTEPSSSSSPPTTQPISSTTDTEPSSETDHA